MRDRGAQRPAGGEADKRNSPCPGPGHVPRTAIQGRRKAGPRTRRSAISSRRRVGFQVFRASLTLFSIMKKAVWITLTSVLVLAVGGYIFRQFFLGSVVKAGVNKFGPGITQTKVQLDAAHISSLSGAGTLTGLNVGNPKGWTEQDAFRLGRIHIDLEPFSILGDHIVINEIIIDQPEFLYETKIVASNVGDLLKNIEQSLGQPGTDAKDKSGKPLKIVIKKFVLRDGMVKLGLGGAAMTLPMPPISMTDIGTAEGGITPGQVVAAVMRSVTGSIVSATTQAMTKINSTFGAAADTVTGAANAIKGLLGGEKK